MPHIHEKIDFTVEVFIVYEDKILLRMHDKYKFWLSVGGHVELDEDPNQAAIREPKEEVGLDVELYDKRVLPLVQTKDYHELISPQFMNRHRINSGHEHVTLVYFARTNTDELSLSESEKSSGCKWFSMEELDDPQYDLRPHVRFYAKTALENLASR